MKTALIFFGFAFAAVRASVVPINGDEKVADADFLQKQKKVLDLYKGVAYGSTSNTENSEFAFPADQFTEPDVSKRFQETYKHGFLPKNGVFTLSCHHTRHETIRLFDLMFFAKDFETFYKVASWAKKNVNPGQFAYAYTLALIHREDTQDFTLPPLYEVFPNYFVAQDTIRSLLNDRIAGLTSKKYEYNNTGYEYNYHSAVFGGPLSTETYNPHTEFKVSYFREDVGLNTYNALWHFRFPSWMTSPKYKKSAWFDKVGEVFYNTHVQIFALYTRERLANGLPYAPPLYWERDIKIGYNPRISHPNGLSFYTRPDNFIPKYFNKYGAHKSMEYEQRIYDAIDSGAYWNTDNDTIVKLEGDSGLDMIGRIIYGAVDKPMRKYFGYLWHTALDALAYAVKTSNDNQYVGGALSTAMTSMRDPLFYSLLNRIVKIFEAYKKSPYRPYKQQELLFPGVTVNDFSSEKLITYFEHFDYEITNALPIKESTDYDKLQFQASELRINHKPFFYNITVTSDKANYALVRVFIGPKYDAEHRELSLEQKRLSLVEFDRFPANLAAGKNILGRNSKDSPIYTRDYEGIKQLSSRIENALKNKESFKINKRYSCGVPDRFQLPIGGKEGTPYTFYVIVSSFEKKLDENVKRFNPTCGSPKLYDFRSLNYPFDRPIHEFEFNVPNFYAEDVLIYHKSEQEINRPQK